MRRPIHLLDGLTVVELGDEVGQIAGRLLADLGARVVKVEPPGGDPLRRVPPLAEEGPYVGISTRFLAWSTGKELVELDLAGERLRSLLGEADVVLTSRTTGPAVPLDRSLAPGSVWVSISPFGDEGPRSHWRGSDLTCMAASGNLFATGDPDRPPLRCSEPLAYAHAAAEAVIGTLTALASGRPETVSVSIQEAAVLISLYGPTDVEHHGDPGVRHGSAIGQVPEIWPCADGYVAFGLRGGSARVASWEALADAIEKDGLNAAAVRKPDWASYDFHHADRAIIAEVVPVLDAFFLSHTMQELFDLAMDQLVMCAPVASPHIVMGYPQLLARGFATSEGPRGTLEGSFAQVVDPPGGGGAADTFASPDVPPWRSRLHRWEGDNRVDRGPSRAEDIAKEMEGEDGSCEPWAGLRIVEFGSGIAGPLISRFFVEYGADCIRVESHARPDVMRTAGTHPTDPTAPRLEGSPFFANLNGGKRSLFLDMSKTEAHGIARQLVDWADVVVENFRPGTLAKWGIDYETVAPDKPEIVIVSSSMWGEGGPHSRYPGYGSQGAALSGHTSLTGWPDRPPCGIYPGALTDSLGPVYAAAAVAAALCRRIRTGRGAHVDLSQIETAAFTLSPWLFDYLVNGHEGMRRGNRSGGDSAPHGVYPCDGHDRWIALAVWSDEEWRRLSAIADLTDLAVLGTSERLARQDEIEDRLGIFTAGRDAATLAGRLQESGIDAYEVLDFYGVHTDLQLSTRGHYVPVEQQVLGRRDADRSSFRLGSALPAPILPGPLFGQHTEELAAEVFGIWGDEYRNLVDRGIFF